MVVVAEAVGGDGPTSGGRVAARNVLGQVQKGECSLCFLKTVFVLFDFSFPPTVFFSSMRRMRGTPLGNRRRCSTRDATPHASVVRYDQQEQEVHNFYKGEQRLSLTQNDRLSLHLLMIMAVCHFCLRLLPT
jgi:hypothetical protein